MNGKALLVKMLPGFIPLLVFVLADSIWGTQTGMIVAVCFGIIEYLFYLIKDKRSDNFILADTLLLVTLGSVSIWLESDSFFLLKPALIELVLASLLGFSVYSRHNIMMHLSKRYMKNIELTDGQIVEFKRNIKILFYIILAHSAMVIYAALYMTKAEWVFISTALFYIVIGLFFVYQFVKVKMFKRNIKQEEWLPIVDINGGVKGKVPRSQCHNKSKILHPVVHLHLIKGNSIYLQKRPLNKLIQPGKWDTSVGGHIAFGETIQQALNREAFEEIGLVDFEPIFLIKYLWETDEESELVYSFYAKVFNEPNSTSDEVEDGKFWPIQQIYDNLTSGIFTPNFEKEFKLIEQILLIN